MAPLAEVPILIRMALLIYSVVPGMPTTIRWEPVYGACFVHMVVLRMLVLARECAVPAVPSSKLLKLVVLVTPCSL